MLSAEDIGIIRDNQAAGITNKTLVEEQLDLIYRHNWFNIWVPKALNGKSMGLSKGIDLLEELAYWDGGLAWTITLCSGANMFAGYLDPIMAKAVYADPKVCLGGSGRVGGKAVWDGTDYVLSGLWQYATGAPHLTHFTLNALVYHAEEQQFDAQEQPLVYSFLIPRDLVLVHYDWNTFGLECTASHSFSLDHTRIHKDYSFQIKTVARNIDDPIYRIPFMPFAELTLLANYMGMYRRFLDLVEKYFFEKSKDSYWQQQFGKERFRELDVRQAQLISYKNDIAVFTEELWTKSVDHEIQEQDDIIQHIASLSRVIVKDIREQVLFLYPFVGISGAQLDNELNRVFRNIFTATQHSLLNG